MKRYKLRKYQTPTVVQNHLETEGFICSDSFSLMISADPLRNMSDPDDPKHDVDGAQSYFEF